MIEQKILHLSQSDAQISNFFHSSNPGSLASYLGTGWVVVYMHFEGTRLAVLLQREHS